MYYKGQSKSIDSHCLLLYPTGAVRIGYIDGQFIVNPLRSQMKQSQLNLVVASSENKISEYISSDVIPPNLRQRNTRHKLNTQLCHAALLLFKFSDSVSHCSWPTFCCETSC